MKQLKLDKFIEKNDAVSPIIGVILLVAITVAIAASLFLTLNSMSGTVTMPVHIEFNVNGDELLVIKTSQDLTYGELDILGNTGNWSLNGVEYNATNAPVIDDAEVQPGDVIGDLQGHIRISNSGGLIYERTFD